MDTMSDILAGDEIGESVGGLIMQLHSGKSLEFLSRGLSVMIWIIVFQDHLTTGPEADCTRLQRLGNL